ncbi:S-layer homology domain-containing protein [Paenibacillus septentrionalis]|uniref:S-layer homology domain-containing protein n=1 Tax=Paenibacillus septentrionalis TaxID=429342 RepID=A0ABW1V4V6_9BACL
MKSTKQLNRKRFLSMLLTLVLMASVFTVPMAQAESLTDVSVKAESNEIPERIRDGVILHAFDWNLEVIEANLQAIADAGYTAIQTSPIMGVAPGEAWFMAYQPRNMEAGGNGNRYGDRDAFVSLTTAAEALGIKIIVDVVPNHIGNPNNSDEPWIDNTHFHNVSSGVGYNDRFLLTQPEMISGLRDLDTHSTFVQQSFIAYLQDMIDAGASGFRYDAIKHIELDDDEPTPASIAAGATNERYADGEFRSDYVKNVTDAVKAYFEASGKENFQYGEVLQGGDPNNDRMAGYAKYIDLTASMYGHHVRSVIEVGDIGRLNKWEDYAAEGLTGERLVPWVESHDTYNNEGESLGFSPKQIRQGWAMIAARKDASPLFFARNINANGNRTASVRTADNVENSKPQWSHPEVVAINKFHNAMAGRDENLVSLGINAVMIERGTIADGGGAVLINTSTTDRVLGSVPVEFLKDGIYVNALDETNVFTVSNGRISGTIPGNSENTNSTDMNANEGLVVLMDREDANPIILAAFPNNDDVRAGNSFSGDELELRMSAINVSNATYSINNGDAVNFEHDEIITVPVTNYDEPIIVTLAGQVNGESITKQFTYTWAEFDDAPPVEESTHVNVYLSINRNEDFQALAGSNIYTYTFNPELFGGWPGNTPMTRMKYNGNDTHWYKIVMPRAAVGGIIFNNNAGSQTGQPPITATMLNNEQLYFYGTGNSGFAINNGANWDTAFAAGDNIGFADSNVFPPGRNGVIFNTSGGSPIDTQYVREGGKATRPTTDPTRDGYIFDGKWYTDADFQNEYDFSTPVVNTLGDDHIYALTLYAGWTQETSNPGPTNPPVNPGPISPPSSNPEPSAPAQPDVVKDGDKAIVELGSSITSISIPVQDIGGLALQVKAANAVVTLQADALKQWLTATGNPSEASVEVTIAPVTSSELANASAKGGHARVEVAGAIYDITLKLKYNDQVINISNVDGGVEITLPYNQAADKDLLGVYYYNEASKEWEYVGGNVDAASHTVTVALEHLSTYAVLAYTKAFTDVPSTHWAARTLEVLAAKHIINGTSDTRFSPDGPTTRAEFTSLLVRALGLTNAASVVPFEDVQAGQWFAEEVAIAYEAGLITGVSETKFDPNAKITREEMAALLVRAYEYQNSVITATGSADFMDSSSISSWAVEEVNKAVSAGLLQGKGNGIFDPASDANRAETAQAILNLINKR